MAFYLRLKPLVALATSTLTPRHQPIRIYQNRESCWSLFRAIHKLFLGICSATGSKNKQTVENRQLFDFEAIVNLVRICLFFHPILNQSPLWVPPPKVLMSRSSSIQYCMFRSNSCGSFGNLGQSFPQSWHQTRESRATNLDAQSRHRADVGIVMTGSSRRSPCAIAMWLSVHLLHPNVLMLLFYG